MVGLDNPIHLLFLLLIVLLLFGAKRLPELGRSLGQGMKGFREALHGEDQEQVLQPPQPQEPVANGVAAEAQAAHKG